MLDSRVISAKNVSPLGQDILANILFIKGFLGCDRLLNYIGIKSCFFGIKIHCVTIKNVVYCARFYSTKSQLNFTLLKEILAR